MRPKKTREYWKINKRRQRRKKHAAASSGIISLQLHMPVGMVQTLREHGWLENWREFPLDSVRRAMNRFLLYHARDGSTIRAHFDSTSGKFTFLPLGED